MAATVTATPPITSRHTQNQDFLQKYALFGRKSLFAKTGTLCASRLPQARVVGEQGHL